MAGGLQIVKLFVDRKIDMIRDQEFVSLKSTVQKQNKQLKKIEFEEKSRNIPEDKIFLITNDLRKLGGEKILITSVLQDEESYYFADQLKVIFEKAGWHVNGVYMSLSPDQQQGLRLVINSKSEEDKAKYLVSVFKSMGLHFRSVMNPQQEEGFGIVVGAK
jgi:hypothetical protein